MLSCDVRTSFCDSRVGRYIIWSSCWSIVYVVCRDDRGSFFKSCFWKAGAISPKPWPCDGNTQGEYNTGTYRRYRRSGKCQFSSFQMPKLASPACNKCKCGWVGFHSEECKEVVGLHVSFTPPVWKKLILFKFISLLVICFNFISIFIYIYFLCECKES